MCMGDFLFQTKHSTLMELGTGLLSACFDSITTFCFVNVELENPRMLVCNSENVSV